mmetsp:Transcript_28851/g.66495  ORF Transcript_28851/g.66495 Transcript_28851/m.66495 type:complete len:230 (+) Transcript_28851:204-893(+)
MGWLTTGWMGDGLAGGLWLGDLPRTVRKDASTMGGAEAEPTLQEWTAFMTRGECVVLVTCLGDGLGETLSSTTLGDGREGKAGTHGCTTLRCTLLVWSWGPSSKCLSEGHGEGGGGLLPWHSYGPGIDCKDASTSNSGGTLSPSLCCVLMRNWASQVLIWIISVCRCLRSSSSSASSCTILSAYSPPSSKLPESIIGTTSIASSPVSTDLHVRTFASGVDATLSAGRRA